VDYVAVVIEVINQTQAKCGAPSGEVGPTTVPTQQLAGFDSVRALSFAIALGERIGQTIPLEGIVISNDGPMSVRGIATLIESLCNGKNNNDK